MAVCDRRVLEIVERLAGHAQALHHGLRAGVLHAGEGDYLAESSL
jgi:hypothetical protein